MNDLYTLQRGDAPLLISIPHLGTAIPTPLRDVYTDRALTLADTDWHLDRLYAFATTLGATMLGLSEQEATEFGVTIRKGNHDA